MNRLLLAVALLPVLMPVPASAERRSPGARYTRLMNIMLKGLPADGAATFGACRLTAATTAAPEDHTRRLVTVESPRGRVSVEFESVGIGENSFTLKEETRRSTRHPGREDAYSIIGYARGAYQATLEYYEKPGESTEEDRMTKASFRGPAGSIDCEEPL